MTMLEVFLTTFLVIGSTLLTAYLLRNKIVEHITTGVEADIVQWLGSAENQEVLQEYMKVAAVKLSEPLKDHISKWFGGKASGVSRNLKALEGDIENDMIDVATGGGFLGAKAREYLDKYPLLKDILFSAMANQKGNLQRGQPPFNPAGLPNKSVQAPRDR